MPLRSTRDRAIALGRRTFGAAWEPVAIAEAPGRIELLGNHVDYNGGPVLAGAIDRVLAVAAGTGAAVETTELIAGDVSPGVATLQIETCREWTKPPGAARPQDYATGVIASLLAHDFEINGGLRLAVSGAVPLGFGMSSSAALCVALVLTLSTEPLEPLRIVEIAREAEHRCGSPVGAMDQSASVAGGVILFEGATTSYTPLQPHLGDYVFAVADSGVPHALADSSYPVRVAESNQALGALQASLAPDLASLGELSPDLWASSRDTDMEGLDDVLRRRVDHVVSEVSRVREGVEAVHSSNWIRFGELMTASGQSSNLAYEISHPRVEELVALLLTQEGVIGARMMGGGEGGPALALIHQDALADVSAVLEASYFRDNPSHLQGDRLQVCVFGPGARLTYLT